MDLATKIILAVISSTGFWTVLCAFAQSLIQKRKKKKSAETRLLLGLAYSEIINRAEAYIHRGYIGTDEYKELAHYLYEPYRDMGGDGTAERLMAQVRALPTEKTES